ncbi:MAG: RnfABCDGE type electron transport complex subunit D [Provencibacterium sp.]|jgi:electron transport complex protein RnfD|nr:RnfABCDGE type electron transport complex subunit D [Provencibacterium sp.]
MLKTYNPPHIRGRDSNKTMMDDVLIVLAAIYLMACYYYGARAAVLGLFSLLVAILCDIVCKLLMGEQLSLRDHSSAVTALLIPLLLPASVSYTTVATAVVFALVVVKYPFGGVGNNLFNPAAGGIAFVCICFPREVFGYPTPLEPIEIFGKFEGRLLYSAAYTLKAGGIPTGGDFMEMLLGNVAGPMGATNALVVCACLLYLIVRRTVHWQAPVCFLLTCALYAYLFPRVAISSWLSVMYELFSGYLILGAIFMLTDPVTSPKRAIATALYAVFAGGVTMLFRQFGGFEESFAFSLLLCNAVAPVFDYLEERIRHQIRRRQRAKI